MIPFGRLDGGEDCHTVCYADDTLLVATSDRLFDQPIIKANIHIARIMRHIGKLGLTVAETKTEAVLFCKKKPRIMPTVRVGGVDVQVNESMKYLGVFIDGSWNFKAHFKYVEAKVTKVTRALSRLMPNLRGPGERKRQLYSNVLTSVAMYAAPMWGGIFSNASEKTLRPLRRLQRTIAIRVTACYRTISFDAATLLARMPPWTLEAAMRQRIFTRISESRRLGCYTLEIDAEIRNGEALLLTRQWDLILNRPGIWGIRTIAAIRPYLRTWLNRRFGEVSYHGAQILSGHGSFGHYL